MEQRELKMKLKLDRDEDSMYATVKCFYSPAELPRGQHGEAASYGSLYPGCPSYLDISEVKVYLWEKIWVIIDLENDPETLSYIQEQVLNVLEDV